MCADAAYMAVAVVLRRTPRVIAGKSKRRVPAPSGAGIDMRIGRSNCGGWKERRGYAEMNRGEGTAELR